MVLTLEFNYRRWTVGYEWVSFPLDKDEWQTVRIKRLLLPVFAIHLQTITVNR